MTRKERNEFLGSVFKSVKQHIFSEKGNPISLRKAKVFVGESPFDVGFKSQGRVAFFYFIDKNGKEMGISVDPSIDISTIPDGIYYYSNKKTKLNLNKKLSANNVLIKINSFKKVDCAIEKYEQRLYSHCKVQLSNLSCEARRLKLELKISASSEKCGVVVQNLYARLKKTKHKINLISFVINSLKKRNLDYVPIVSLEENRNLFAIDLENIYIAYSSFSPDLGPEVSIMQARKEHIDSYTVESENYHPFLVYKTSFGKTSIEKTEKVVLFMLLNRDTEFSINNQTKQLKLESANFVVLNQH